MRFWPPRLKMRSYRRSREGRPTQSRAWRGCLRWRGWRDDFLMQAVEKHLTFCDQKLILVTAPLRVGDGTAAGTGPGEEGPNFTSSTLLLFLLAHLRMAAWRTPGSGDTGKVGLHTRGGVVAQILSRERLPGFAYFACLLGTAPWKGPASMGSAADSHPRLANPRAGGSVLRVRPLRLVSLLAAGKERTPGAKQRRSGWIGLRRVQ